MSASFPRYLEEPEKHDVLLARIAAREGISLLLSSFSAIHREGVAFVTIKEAGILQLQLGLPQDKEQMKIYCAY